MEKWSGGDGAVSAIAMVGSALQRMVGCPGNISEIRVLISSTTTTSGAKMALCVTQVIQVLEDWPAMFVRSSQFMVRSSQFMVRSLSHGLPVLGLFFISNFKKFQIV